MAAYNATDIEQLGFMLNREPYQSQTQVAYYGSWFHFEMKTWLIKYKAQAESSLMFICP